MEHVRFEVLPTPSVEELVLGHVPREVPVTVTASPARGLDTTLDLAVSLAQEGYRAVPHVAARMVTGRSELEEIVARLTGAGITSIFVPAGDGPPAGDYRDALGLLEDLDELGRPFSHVGITGYPEPHPTIHDDLLIQSMWDKRKHATHVVSNMTFDPALIRAWVPRLRMRGVALPVLLGVPGPVERAKLLRMATRIGVGESTKFLAKQGGLMARLMTPGGFTGERFLIGCAPTLASLDAGVEGLHLYTFNQVVETEAWRREFIERLDEHGV